MDMNSEEYTQLTAEILQDIVHYTHMKDQNIHIVAFVQYNPDSDKFRLSIAGSMPRDLQAQIVHDLCCGWDGKVANALYKDTFYPTMPRNDQS